MVGSLLSLSTTHAQPFSLFLTSSRPSQVDGITMETNKRHDNDTTDNMIVLLQRLVAEVQTMNQNVSIFSGHRLGQVFNQSGTQIIPHEQQQNAQESLANSETGVSSLMHANQLGHPTEEELAMLECFPTPELLFLILQELKTAINPCDCKIGGEPVSVFSMGKYPQKTHGTHWTFRNAILVLFTDLVSSAPFRFTLHSPKEKPSPDLSAACRNFVQREWPSSIVRATWSTFPEPLESDQDRCPFWGFNGSSLHSTFVHQLYVRPIGAGFQLQGPRMSYRLDEGVQSVKYLRVNPTAGTSNNLPQDPGEMHIGQIWSVNPRIPGI